MANSYTNTSLLDRNRPRKVVFYGRVSTEHEAQMSALGNQMQWYDDVATRFPNWTVVDRYIIRYAVHNRAMPPHCIKNIRKACHSVSFRQERNTAGSLRRGPPCSAGDTYACRAGLASSLRHGRARRIQA